MFSARTVLYGLLALTLSTVVPGGGGCAPEPGGGTTTDNNSGGGGGGSQTPTQAAGKFYFGVFPGDASAEGEEDDVTPGLVQAFEQAVGRSVAWVYFSHNWFRGRTFPQSTAAWIRDNGDLPFIRLMLRSDAEQDHAEPVYNLSAILSGQFDSDLAAWGQAARAFGAPLLVEWGTECNGQWFSWNGFWNGRGTTNGFGDPNVPDGPERFVAAYRRIIDVVRGAGASNITWVFHVNAPDVPDDAWNRFENYYPGNTYIDWLAISVYGAETPLDTGVESFRDQLDPEYNRLTQLAPGKPIVVAEMGSTANNFEMPPETWTDLALTDLFVGRWPGITGFAWWNEGWQNDNNPANDTSMIVQNIPALAEVFRRQLSQNGDKLQDPPVIDAN